MLYKILKKSKTYLKQKKGSTWRLKIFIAKTQTET